ncbi:uncharacterized protein LOC126617041 [Malus sylvestris]|uniref:uncharacterized protein n=1 Tax=Malus domestica TaxID=3750 RepID=UPI000498B8B0|nr:uncharacterized protein LOC126617041 [Malus sylvestris]
MAIVLRYMDNGHVIERFVGIEHVVDTKASSLNLAIDDTWIKHISSSSGKKNSEIGDPVTIVSSVVNVGLASSKLHDILREKHTHIVLEALENNELSSGQSLNQEATLKRVLGITNDLSLTLQKKDQDIVNAMNLVNICKGCEKVVGNPYLMKFHLFCDKNHIKIPSMDNFFKSGERPNRKAHPIIDLHHYRVDLSTYVIDKQLTELNDRFTEKNTELLLYVACLSPSNSFSAFDKEKLMRLAQFYPSDFLKHDLELLKEQLKNYIWDMTSNSKFANLKGISDLAKKMVGTKKDQTYPLLYLLLTLALILLVATASVERAFSAMNKVKNTLHN